MRSFLKILVVVVLYSENDDVLRLNTNLNKSLAHELRNINSIRVSGCYITINMCKIKYNGKHEVVYFGRQLTIGVIFKVNGEK